MANNEVDVTVSVLGIQVNKLSGTLNNKDFEIKDNVSLLGIVTGTIGLKAEYSQPTGNGLYIEGQLTGPGFNTGELDFCIIPW